MGPQLCLASPGLSLPICKMGQLQNRPGRAPGAEWLQEP